MGGTFRCEITLSESPDTVRSKHKDSKVKLTLNLVDPTQVVDILREKRTKTAESVGL